MINNGQQVNRKLVGFPLSKMLKKVLLLLSNHAEVVPSPTPLLFPSLSRMVEGISSWSIPLLSRPSPFPPLVEVRSRSESTASPFCPKDRDAIYALPGDEVPKEGGGWERPGQAHFHGVRGTTTTPNSAIVILLLQRDLIFGVGIS